MIWKQKFIFEMITCCTIAQWFILSGNNLLILNSFTELLSIAPPHHSAFHLFWLNPLPEFLPRLCHVKEEEGETDRNLIKDDWNDCNLARWNTRKVLNCQSPKWLPWGKEFMGKIVTKTAQYCREGNDWRMRAARTSKGVKIQNVSH